MSDLIKSGKLWPIGVSLAITGVFGLGVWTIMVTDSANIQESNAFLTTYQKADADINKYIKARQVFDKKYTIKYITNSIGVKNPTVEYKLTDKSGHAVNDGKITINISRPETHIYDQTLNNPTVKDGVYTFSGVKFPKVGIWNIIAKVSVGKDYRFYNIKADTRGNQVKGVLEAYEY